MYKDTYNIEPSYLLARIQKEFEVTYMSHPKGESSAHTLLMHVFVDESKAQLVLDQCHHLFFADEKNKLILIELVELIKEKDKVIKKISAAYRKKIQRERQKWDSRIKPVDMLAQDAYSLKRLAQYAEIQQKELLQILIKNFDQMNEEDQKKLIEKSTRSS